MSKEWTKSRADFYEQAIKNDGEKFVLWEEINNQNLSIAQRKFLKTLTCAFHNKIGAFEPDVCNLTCIQIRQVVELFSRYLLNQMICLEKPKQFPNGVIVIGTEKNIKHYNITEKEIEQINNSIKKIIMTSRKRSFV